MDESFQVKMTNPLIDSMSTEITNRTISWEAYFQAQIINEEEYNFISHFDKENPLALHDLMSKDGIHVAFNLIKVISKISAVEVDQYLLVKLDQILFGNEKTFIELEKLDPNYPFNPLLKFLSRDDEFLKLKAGKVLTQLVYASETTNNQALTVLHYWIGGLLESMDKDKVDLASNCLTILLRNSSFKKTFSFHGVENLAKALKTGPTSPQIQYQILFSIWLISFDSFAAVKLQQEYELLNPILEICKNSSKEKIIRICVAIFRNMFEKAKEISLPIMIGGKLFNFLETLQGRNFADEEIQIDILFLKEELSKVIQHLRYAACLNGSSFDEYASEVKSGKLEWSPPHQSDLFWKQNSGKFNENDNELLKTLTRLLCTSTDPQILSIACNDIGHYAKFNPTGRQILQNLGTKQQIMQLMNHENSDVRYNALMAVQKYMINIWNN